MSTAAITLRPLRVAAGGKFASGVAGFADARVAIEKAFAAGWAAQTGTVQAEDSPINVRDVQIIYEAVEADTVNTPYVALYIKDGDSSQIEIGPRPALARYLGMVLAVIITEDRKGTQQARVLADAVGGVFYRASMRYGQSGLIRFRVPKIAEAGVHDGRYELQVSIPFWRDRQQ